MRILAPLAVGLALVSASGCKDEDAVQGEPLNAPSALALNAPTDPIAASRDPDSERRPPENEAVAAHPTERLFGLDIPGEPKNAEATRTYIRALTIVDDLRSRFQNLLDLLRDNPDKKLKDIEAGNLGPELIALFVEYGKVLDTVLAFAKNGMYTDEELKRLNDAGDAMQFARMRYNTAMRARIAAEKEGKSGDEEGGE